RASSLAIEEGELATESLTPEILVRRKLDDGRSAHLLAGGHLEPVQTTRASRGHEKHAIRASPAVAQRRFRTGEQPKRRDIFDIQVREQRPIVEATESRCLVFRGEVAVVDDDAIDHDERLRHAEE